MTTGLLRSSLLAILVLTAGCASLIQDLTPRQERLSPAEALVWSEPFPNLVVEIDHVAALEERTPSLAPSEEAIDIMERALDDVTAKQSIEVRGSAAFNVNDSSPDKVWSFEEIQDLHERTFDAGDPTLLGEEDTAYLHILYLNGKRADTAVVGFSVGPWLVLFPDQYDPTTATPLDGLVPAPNPAPEKVERSVLVHEVGHSLGLVDNGAPMTEPRLADDDCACHSEHEESVMYPFARNREAVLEAFQDNQHAPYRFDEADLDDLKALRDAQPS